MADTIAGIEPLLDVGAAAQVLGITPRTLQKWVQSRRIPYLRIGKLTKFKASVLRAWIDAQEVKAMETGEVCGYESSGGTQETQ